MPVSPVETLPSLCLSVCPVAFTFLAPADVLPAPKAPTKVTLAGHRLVIKQMLFAGQLIVCMYSIVSYLVLILLSLKIVGGLILK